MTRTPKDASAARTGPSTTNSDAAAPAPAAAAAEAAPQAGGNVEETASAVDATLGAEPRAEDDSDSSSDSDGEIPLCDAPVVKKRKVEARTSCITMTDSERYKKDEAGCAERLKKREADEMVPCIDPEIGEDDQGVGARFQGYDGFTISGPPVFR